MDVVRLPKALDNLNMGGAKVLTGTAAAVVLLGQLVAIPVRADTMEGALLRLRPKVMTVATVVAGLLPLLWSTRTGAEFMRPLAAPVLGGMLSSLLHVLIVTPVIFTWLRERELRSVQTQ